MMNKDFSQYRLFAYLTLAIFTAEFAIMFGLKYFEHYYGLYLEFFDGFFLILIVTPLVYYFAIRPLKAKIDELERFSRLVVGREMKMAELKKRISELEGKK